MNIIDTIRVSGTDYTLSATSSGGITSGEVQTMIDESVSGITERMAEDEEVTAAALNNLNDRINGISGNNAVEVTQAEYDALVSGGTVDPTAFYIITDATPVDISNYWTSAQTNSAINAAVSGKVDTSTFNTYSGNVETALSGKQDTLSAGTGIDITDNVISATGGGGGKAVSGGTNISITTGATADTINCTVPASASSGNYSIMFGQTASSGDASGSKSMTGGQWSKAYSEGSVAIGQMNESRSPWAWAIGNGTSAVGKAAFACGEHNSTNNPAEFTCGFATITSGGSDTSLMTLFTVGNGKYQGGYQRHNALDIRMNGDIYISDTNSTSVSNYWEKPMIKLQDALGGGGTVDQTIISGSTNAVAGGAVYSKIDEVEQVTAAALNNINDTIGNINTILESI